MLGGVLLAGRDLPLEDGQDDPASLAVLAALAEAAPAVITRHHLATVACAFRFAGDIPMTTATLAGFYLGVRYAEPYLPPASPGPQALITAAYHLANR